MNNAEEANCVFFTCGNTFMMCPTFLFEILGEMIFTKLT